jgi:hypothetical protein
MLIDSAVKTNNVIGTSRWQRLASPPTNYFFRAESPFFPYAESPIHRAENGDNAGKKKYSTKSKQAVSYNETACLTMICYV